jgi:hypothetical protein
MTRPGGEARHTLAKLWCKLRCKLHGNGGLTFSDVVIARQPLKNNEADVQDALSVSAKGGHFELSCCPRRR